MIIINGSLIRETEHQRIIECKRCNHVNWIDKKEKRHKCNGCGKTIGISEEKDESTD